MQYAVVTFKECSLKEIVFSSSKEKAEKIKEEMIKKYKGQGCFTEIDYVEQLFNYLS